MRWTPTYWSKYRSSTQWPSPLAQLFGLVQVRQSPTQRWALGPSGRLEAVVPLGDSGAAGAPPQAEEAFASPLCLVCSITEGKRNQVLAISSAHAHLDPFPVLIQQAHPAERKRRTCCWGKRESAFSYYSESKKHTKPLALLIKDGILSPRTLEES